MNLIRKNGNYELVNFFSVSFTKSHYFLERNLEISCSLMIVSWIFKD